MAGIGYDLLFYKEAIRRIHPLCSVPSYSHYSHHRDFERIGIPGEHSYFLRGVIHRYEQSYQHVVDKSVNNMNKPQPEPFLVHKISCCMS